MLFSKSDNLTNGKILFSSFLFCDLETDCKRTYVFIRHEDFKMDPKKMGDFAGRLKSGGKGLGTGVGFLAAAGALAYGVSQSIYTGSNTLQ